MSHKVPGNLCTPHVKGVNPGTPPFFYEWCGKCQEKLAAGKVRGDEGPVRDRRGYQNRPRVPLEKLEALHRNKPKVPYGRGPAKRRAW